MPVQPTLPADALDLVAMNTAVEELGDGRLQLLPGSVWEEWLWRSDPNDPPSSDCLLNKNQLLGLLICRYRAARQPSVKGRVCLVPSRLVVVQDRAPSEMTLREVRCPATPRQQAHGAC